MPHPPLSSADLAGPAPSPSASPPASPRSVAVVAVHGVGQQRPGESARAMADLLLRLRTPEGTARYSAMRELPLRLPTHPVRVSPRPEVGRLDTPVSTSRWREQSDALAQQLADSHGSASYAAEYELMRGQLEGYASTCDPYDTIRLEGTRVPDLAPDSVAATNPGRPAAATPVHVYEMYWADLSRVGSGALRVFGAFYQLLFNVAHLGRLSLDHATLTFRGQREWRRYARLHTAAVRLLTVFVPISWLSMLATSLGLVVLALPGAAKTLAVSVVAGAVAAVALVLLLRALQARGAAWWAVPLGAIGAANAAALFITRAMGTDAASGALLVDRVFVCSWTLVACGALLAIYRAYETLRPGAFVAGAIATVLVAVTSLAWLPWAASPEAVLGRTLTLFAVETALTVGLWYGFYATGAVSFIAGVVAERRLAKARATAADPTTTDTTADATTARAARTTATATLALSASAVLVITFTLWSATLAASRPVLRALDPSQLHLVLPWFTPASSPRDTIAHYLTQILEASAGAGYPFLLWCLLGFGVLVLVALGPSLLLELTAPARPYGVTGHAMGADEPPARGLTAAASRAVDDLSEREGRALDDGLRLLERSAILLFLSTFVLQPLVSMLHWLDATTRCCGPVRGALDWLYGNGAQWVTWSGGVIVVAGLGLLLLRDRIGPLIDTALDVDNYLREHPRARTPRARIAERYAALLRHLNAWRDAEGRPYERVVLVSHSQGTVITVELLGFARCERAVNPDLFPLLDADASPEAPRLALFTMGSPLRQLYQRAFPSLFAWMHATHARWGTPPELAAAQQGVGAADTAPSDPRPSIAAERGPRPEPFGLWRWVNAYRSSDYVGRAFWNDPDESRPYRAAPADGAPADGAPGQVVIRADATGRRREFCLGRGAHTHYWNASAHPVAAALDHLVAEPV